MRLRGARRRSAWHAAAALVDRLSDAYTADARPLAAVRILLAVQVLVLPRDISWIGTLPQSLYDPPPGLMTLIPSQFSAEGVLAVEILRAAVAAWVLIGWRTRTASAVLSAILVLASGMGYSYGKVDHLILYDLAPLALGFAGWGAAWSLDARRRRAAAPSGFPMLLWGMTIAFAMVTAAAAKATSGWLDPGRLATRGYVVAYSLGGDSPAPVGSWLLSIDVDALWKLLDYATLFAEGWLVVAVLFPGLFRIGLLLLAVFHVGVFLLLGIDFSLYAFAYAGFFCLAPAGWLPELAWLRERWRPRGRVS